MLVFVINVISDWDFGLVDHMEQILAPALQLLLWSSNACCILSSLCGPFVFTSRHRNLLAPSLWKPFRSITWTISHPRARGPPYRHGRVQDPASMQSSFGVGKATIFKIHPKPEARKTEYCLPLKTLATPKLISIPAHSQREIWWIFCMVTKSKGHTQARAQAENAMLPGPFMGRLCFLSGERKAICLRNQP